MVARHIGRSASYLFAALSALLMAALAGIVVLFAVGPLRLDFLKDDLARALAAELPGYEVSIGSARLAWDGRRRGLAVQLDAVNFAEPATGSTVALPHMAVDLDRRQLLWGALRPTEVVVDGPSMTVRRTAEGKLSLTPATGAADDWRSLLHDLIEAGDSLRRVEVRGASLDILDEVSGGRLRVPSVDLGLTRLADGIGLQMSGDVGFNRRRATVSASGVYRGAEGESAIDIRFAGVRPSDVVNELSLAALAPLAGADLPVSGRLDLRLSADGVLREVTYALQAGTGTVAWAGLPQPATIRHAAIGGSVDPVAGRVRIAGLRVELAGGATIDAAGEIVVSAGAVGGDISARLADLDTAALVGYWPEQFAAGARRWVAANVQNGRIVDAELVVAAAPGDFEALPPPPDLVALSFAFEDATVSYWQPLPPLEGGRGSARLTVQDFDLTLQGGRSGGLDLTGGRVRIDGLSAEAQVARIEVSVAGPATRALALLDREPLGFASDLGLPPDQVSGDARVQGAFTVPLRSQLALADIGYSAEAVLSRFSMPAIFGRYPLRDGELSLAVDASGIGAEGSVLLNGLPVALSWRRDFGLAAAEEPAVYPDRYGLAASADAGAFKAVGLDLTDLMRGPVAATVQLWVAEDGRMEARGEAELAAAEITSLLLRWHKPAATPAQARFRLRTGADGGLDIEEVVLTAGSDLVVGSARLDPEGALRRVELPVLRLAGQDLAATMVWPPGDGPVEAQVRGRLLDARPFLADAEAGEAGGLSAVLAIEVDRLQIDDDTALAAAQGDLTIDAGRLDGVRLSGRLNGSAPLALRVVSAADHRDLLLTSSDAGGILRALSVLEDAEAGSLRLSARIPGDGGPTAGRLLAADMRVRRAPLLARILALGSIQGIQDTFAGEGLTLRHVELPFLLTSERIELRDGRAIGPDIGLTLSGSIDRKRHTLDLSGTLVPTYTLNRLLGEIPILGNILIGRRGEGVFAVTYGIAGPVDDPTVSVNPLSALAPGILRRLVEGLLPSGAAAGPEETPMSDEERRSLR